MGRKYKLIEIQSQWRYAAWIGDPTRSVDLNKRIGYSIPTIGLKDDQANVPVHSAAVRVLSSNRLSSQFIVEVILF